MISGIRWTSGQMHGVVRKMEIKKRAYGFRNKERFKIAI